MCGGGRGNKLTEIVDNKIYVRSRIGEVDEVANESFVGRNISFIKLIASVSKEDQE